MNIQERMKKPVPDFFRKVRQAGLVIAAVGTALVTAPVALPVAVITTGSYLLVAGTVLCAVAQATVVQEPDALKRMQKKGGDDAKRK